MNKTWAKKSDSGPEKKFGVPLSETKTGASEGSVTPRRHCWAPTALFVLFFSTSQLLSMVFLSVLMRSAERTEYVAHVEWLRRTCLSALAMQ